MRTTAEIAKDLLLGNSVEKEVKQVVTDFIEKNQFELINEDLKHKLIYCLKYLEEKYDVTIIVNSVLKMENFSTAFNIQITHNMSALSDRIDIQFSF